MSNLKELIAKRDNLTRKIDKKMQNTFPPGRVIKFKCGNMKDYQEARVVSASAWHGEEQIHARNLITGKDRALLYCHVHPDYQ